MITNFEDYYQFEAAKLPEIYAMFEGITPPDDATVRANLLKAYTAKVEPYVKLIGQQTGESGAILNPLRTITKVEPVNGRVCVFFKRKGDKLERYQQLN